MHLSVVIPAHNEEKYIEKTIECAFCALHSWSGHWELIVVDNASTDDTPNILAHFKDRIKVAYEPIKGLTQARETGRKMARGEIICYLDADTIVNDKYFNQLMYEYDTDPDVVGIGNPYEFYDGSKLLRFGCKVFFNLVWRCVDGASKLQGKPSFLFGPSFSFRSKTMEEIGGFNTKIKFYGEDSDTTKRIGRVGKTTFLWNNIAYTSSRRYAKIGVLKTCWIYLVNYFGVMFKGKDYYNDSV